MVERWPAPVWLLTRGFAGFFMYEDASGGASALHRMLTRVANAIKDAQTRRVLCGALRRSP